MKRKTIIIFTYHVLLPEVMEAIEIQKVEVSGRPVNEHTIFMNHRFKNAITLNIHIRKYMLENYYDQQHKVQQTIEQIEKFLDQ